MKFYFCIFISLSFHFLAIYFILFYKVFICSLLAVFKKRSLTTDILKINALVISANTYQSYLLHFISTATTLIYIERKTKRFSWLFSMLPVFSSSIFPLNSYERLQISRQINDRQTDRYRQMYYTLQMYYILQIFSWQKKQFKSQNFAFEVTHLTICFFT